MQYGKLELVVYSGVYEPAEDSFMLAKAARGWKGRILDMGTGCGIAALANAEAIPGNSVTGVDINTHAIACARENARKNNIKNVTFIESNLFKNIRETFDAILFNPPYLPTAPQERVHGPLNDALDGGTDGRKTLDRFLTEAPRYLAPGGRLLFIQSSLNGIGLTEHQLRERGHRMRIMEEQAFFFEKLYVIKSAQPI